MKAILHARTLAGVAFCLSAAAPRWAFAAATAATTASADIRDIRAPFAFPNWWRSPLLAAAALAIVLGAASFAWWRHRRARALTPLARARIALLAAEEHARAGRSRAWADVVADTLRAGLGARLGSEILPQTTSELASADWAAQAQDVLELLRICDLTRFAMASLDRDALLASTLRVRDLVEQLFTPHPPGQSSAPAREPGLVQP